MKIAARIVVLCLAALGAAGASSAETARERFEKGLLLAWGFNFAEAARAMRDAARLDPACALCYWGIAYALGPSINHDPTRRASAAARRAAARAVSLGGASPVERGLIAAMHRRTVRGERAYAAAMKALADAHPDNPDVLVLAAEAAMNLHPHDYWRGDGAAQPWTADIVALLERALALAPAHPGGNHYVVHLYENSREPERALAAVERLGALASTPGLGHLLHMPAHIYLRLGRYRDAVLANQRAIAADDAYLRTASGNAAYVQGYARHNVHFLWAAALMDGDQALARQAAARLASDADLHGPRSGTDQHFLALPLYTDLAFEDWPAILAAAQPPRTAPYTRGVWRYARGVAFAQAGDGRAARAELRALQSFRGLPGKVKASHSHASLLALAAHLLRARIAAAEGDLPAAVAHAEQAVAAEERLARDDPAMEIAFRSRLQLERYRRGR